MKNKIVIIVLSVVCIVLLSMVIFIGGYKTNFFKRQFVKLGWIEMEANDKDDYWCIVGWNQCLKKMNNDVDVVFYGNSITSGSDFREFFPDVSICNLGYPGDDLYGLIFRAYTIAAVNPEKVFVLGGINGLGPMPMDVFEERYEKMIESIHKAVPQAQIYLQSILPVIERNGLASNEKIMECNQIIEKLAAKHGCKYINIHSIYLKDNAMNPKYTKDGVHLKPEHYDKWAERIKPYIYK